MKTTRFLFTVSVLALTSVSAKADLFLVGAATPAGWDKELPEQMISLGYDCYLWDGWLEEGDFKFLTRRGDWNSSVVATEPDLNFESGKLYPVLNAAGNYDFKFYNDRRGYRRIVVDLGKMTVRIKRPTLLMVGPAALGWTDDPVKNSIPVFADDDGKVGWSGQLGSGSVKFLAGDDWYPCYNAPWEGDRLTPGGHQLIYNETETVDGVNVDFKFDVPRAGFYSLTFNLPYGVDVALADEPDLRGGFRAAGGRYLIAFDRYASRMHMARVPSQLYIGTDAGHCSRIEPVGNGVFSSTVALESGSYYKLSYDPSRWENTALSPNRDENLVAGTSNIAPMHGYSYTVPESGNYAVTADFSGSEPTLKAVRVGTTGLDTVESPTASVGVDGREIVVTGTFETIGVYDLCGTLLSASPRTAVSPGVYVVKVDDNVRKIMVR